jgi:hypothetical protein
MILNSRVHFEHDVRDKQTIRGEVAAATRVVAYPERSRRSALAEHLS